MDFAKAMRIALMPALQSPSPDAWNKCFRCYFEASCDFTEGVDTRSWFYDSVDAAGPRSASHGPCLQTHPPMLLDHHPGPMCKCVHDPFSPGPTWPRTRRRGYRTCCAAIASPEIVIPPPTITVNPANRSWCLAGLSASSGHRMLAMSSGGCTHPRLPGGFSFSAPRSCM